MWHCPYKGLCKQFKNCLFTPRILAGEWYPAPGGFLRKILITQRNLNQNQNILTQAQAGSNYEENSPKKSHVNRQGMISREDWLAGVSYLEEIPNSSNNSAKSSPKLKIFQPIGQWPRQVRMMKKLGGRKSCWTVPLRQTRIDFYSKALLSYPKFSWK